MKMKDEYDSHVVRKAECQQAKAADKFTASMDKTKVVVTFDLQSVLQIPSMDVSPLYHSRKLCFYNFTIHNAIEPHDAYCYCWTEVEGKRGSCETGTCLYNYLKKLPEEVTEVTLYSDTCGGQNRNKNVAALLLYAVQKTHISTIHQKFLESGHTEMKVDSMHSAIERAKRYVPVYTALDWHTIFRNARRNHEYTVVPLSHRDFVDLNRLSRKLKNLTKAADGSKLQWLKVKSLKFSKQMPGVIEFRYGHVGPYTVLNIYDKHGHSRASKLPSTLPPLYKTMLPISKAKCDDLCKLCRTKVIPQEVQQWYYQLPFQPGVPDKTVEPSVDDSVDDDEDTDS